MKWTEFVSRFSDDQEIGRDLQDEKLDIYYDNGVDVGQWSENRRTTEGVGHVLSYENAEIARSYYKSKRTR